MSRSFLAIVASASGAVVLQKTFDCWGHRADGKSCDELATWNLVSSSASLLITALLLLLVHMKPHSLANDLDMKFVDLLLVSLWTAGVTTGTFTPPNCLAGNAYFGTWIAFFLFLAVACNSHCGHCDAD